MLIKLIKLATLAVLLAASLTSEAAVVIKLATVAPKAMRRFSRIVWPDTLCPHAEILSRCLPIGW